MGWSKATKPPSGISYFFVLVFVIVPVLSQIPPGSPVIDGPQVIVLNSQITLTCTSSRGNPAPSVKWFKDDTEITNGISTTTAGTAVTTSLTFTATLDDHLEVYECQAENGVLQNPLTTTKYIEVHFSPEAPVLTGPTTLTPSQQGIWTCVSANGYPAGVMSMRNQNKNTQFTTEFTSSSVLDQKSYDVTGTLTWSPVIVNNGDTICCDVTHTTTLGSTPQTVCRQITVADPIAINAPVTQYTPTLQTTVTLQCDVTQGTANQIIWIKDNVQLNINNNNRLTGGTVATESLTITNVQQSDGGNYVCRGIDAVTGNIVNTDTINVAPVGTPPVTSIPQPSYTQITGQQIILGCTVQSPNSPLQEVQWTFTNNQGQTTDPIAVSTSNGKYSGSSVNSPSLTINNVASTDQGTYSCKARNLVGTSTNNPTTTLTVTGSLPVVQINPSTYTATYGSQVVINCNIVSASPAATQVYWQRSLNNQILRIDNGDQGYQGSTTSTPSLTINFATTANAGVYTCFATNAVGTGTSNQGTVTITGGLLSVFVTPQNQNVVQGAQQRITCTVSGTPSAQNIAWLFTAAGSNQQTQLNTGNSQKYSLGTTQDPFLTVLNFQPSDAGTYVCRATNAAGSTSSNPGATLTYITVPTTNVEPRQYTATVGDASFQIQCLVTATPGATSWYWTFQPVGGSQQTIAQGTNDNQYTVDNSGTNPHLTIKSIALDEAGIYTCYATNAAGTSDSSNNPSSRHTLTVTGAILTVTISPATANVIRGNTQTIDCNPQGNPAATQITWYFTPSGSNTQQLLNIVNSGGKYNGGTPGNPDLTITDFQTNNAGSYRCAATNAAGTGTSSNSVLTYVDPLSISVTPADGSATYGDALYTIQCTITGTTPTSWSWSKRPVAGGVVSTISAGSKYLIANSANAPHLTINNVVEDDEQDYFCQATNPAGTVTSSRARLIVNGGLLSVAISPSNADVLQGQSQLISCTVTGTPSATAISWRFTPSGSSQQQTISLGNTAKYSGGTTQNPSLTVLNFQSSDGGSYVCSATNAVGTSSSTTSVLRYIQQLTISVSPSDGTAIYGDSSYTIQCSITGTPQATSWSWVRMPISGGGETPISAGTKYSIVNSATAPHLTINNVVEDDEQDYYCRATNVAGTQTSTRARLIVNGDLLSVTISPANADVLQGQSQLITCTVSGNPAATSISWRFTPSGSNQQQTLSLGNTAKYSGGSTQNPSLTVLNFQSSDGGTYVCSATNAVGTSTSTTSVLRYIQQLTISVSPSDGTAVYGTASYTIQCSITGTPQATSWTWQRRPQAGGSLTTISSGNKYSIVNSATAPHLTINNIVESDEQDYFCGATNVAGSQTSSRARLTVTGDLLSVSISPANADVLQGQSQLVTCIVSGNPAATSISWRFTPSGSNQQQTLSLGNTAKYSGGTTQNPSLTVLNFQSSDGGSYVCSATNAVGTRSSTTSVLRYIQQLSVTVSPSDGTAVYGDSSYTIQCSITGTPQATSWTWTRRPTAGGSETTISAGTKYTIVNSATAPHLTINSIVEADEQDYFCAATNVAGTQTSTRARLTVTGELLTVSISPANAEVIRGNSQIITCTVSGNPSVTNVAWTKDGQSVNVAGNPTKYSGGTPGNPSLTVTNFETTDAGSYICIATNAVGSQSSSTSVLTYIEFLSLTVSPSSGSAVLGAQTYVIACQITGNPTATNWYWTKTPSSGGQSENINRNTNNNKYTVQENAQNPQLTIKNIQQSDDANYVCNAQNTAGLRTSSAARLIVTGQLASITASPSTQFANYGANSVTIQCSVSASPSATAVGWRKVSLDGQTSTEIDAQNSNNKYSIVNSLTAPHLTINNVDFNDDSNYVCFATNAVGTGTSNNARVDVIGSAPQVSIPQSAYSVIYGSDITIPCTILNANPAHFRVTWYYTGSNNQQTTINTGDPSQYSGGVLGNPGLTILNANNQDAGFYKCEAENQVNSGQSSNTQLNVIGGALTVTIPSSTYSVLLGNQISITCTVSGSPSATNVYWMKQQTNGGSFSNVDITGNNRYSGGTLSSPTLVINSAQFSDEGNYRCHGVNAAGDANSIVTNLDVTGSAPVVNVASNAYSVNIGNSITLQCNVQANPFHTSVKWQRVDVNGNAVDIDMTNSRYTGSEVNSPSLVISQTMKSDEGRYVCLATNAVGTGQSQQTYLTVVGSTPTVTVDQPQYSANKGSDITLQCSYTANPAATMVRWERANGNNVVEIGDTTNNNKYSGSTVSSPSLIIYNAEESDEGIYKCKVTNSVGTGISTTTNLDVVGNIPIVTVPTSAYTVNVDGSITLACQVTADPTHTQVYWQKVTGGNTQTITINGGKYTGSSVTIPALTISNAQFADAGTYYCFARNSVGTGSSTQVVLAVSGNTPSVSLTQNAMTVNYGNNVTIGCVVSANPSHTSVYWQKISGGNTVTIDMSNTNKYGGGTVASPSLYIIRADTSDAANYVCFAANSVGTGQSNQGTLTVAGSVPVVTIPQNQYTNNIGNDMTIPCNIQSNPQHTQVYWTKKVGNSPAQQLPQGTSDYGGGNVNSPSLIIYNLEEADEAQYNCFAVNIVGTGSASSPTFLNVIGNPPVVTASIPNSVRLGDPVTITCVVVANPGATQIRWKFITNNAESVIDINNNNRYTGGSVQTPSLTISPVEEVDRGSYKCEATNAEGTASSSPVFLNTVGDPPTNLAINPSPITVEEGEVITATCSATGNPNPTFEWRKLGSDNVISNSPVLTINNAQESHKGTYICKAINTMGSGEVQTTVTVHYKPKVTITTTPVQGKKGQSVEIPCEFTSNPFATSVIWTKIVGGQSSQLNLNGNKYQGATVTHPSLTILDLQASDIADYRCSVLNNVGVGNSNIGRVDVDLTVAPFGIMITPNGITVLEGNAFSMFCNATANPSPQYEWYHKDTKVGDGQTYTVQNSIWTPHDGLYTCKAYNSAGEQQATIDVDVKYIPVSAVTTNTFSQVLNSPITLSCDTLANPSAISWQWKYNGFILDGQTEKLYTVDMNNEQDAGQYTCIAYNEVGHSVDIHFSVTVGSGVTPGTGASVASAGLTGGEIAAICLGILFFILLLIVLCVCCILQGCCAMCFGAGAGKDKERRITPDHEKLDIPRFYEVPTVVTREPSMISKRDVYVDTVPMAYGAARPQNDYEITKYRVVRPEYDVGERYVTHSAASRPYYLPAIEYTYDEEERRRRRRKKKKSRHHQDELRGDEQIVLEERVVSNGGGDIYRTTSSRTGNDVEVIAGPEYYFEAE